jgi:murein L,D-transpeptidase YcbB/YkuD
MRNPRQTRILASTALALVLAIPFGSLAIEQSKLAAAPMAGMPTAPAQALPAPQLPANDALAAAIGAATNPATNLTTNFVTNPAIATEPAATTEQAAAPADPLASLDPADRAVAEKLRELLATKAEKFFAGKKERAAVEAFYQKRNLAPLWLDKGVENARAVAVVARMKAATADGLEAGEYKAPNFGGLAADALAEAELKLTATVLTFARHLQAGRFPYTRVSRNIELPQAAPEPADIIERVANAADAGKTLDEFSPQQEPYRKLKAILAELRGKAGDKSGNAGQIETVIANMERWRWYPRDLGSAHVSVNLPDFTLKVVHNGTPVWSTRIVIGKPSMATPLLSETMKDITVNPTWTVPQSIVQNEYLPALAQDPTVLERMGLRVSYNGGHVQITQPPGEGNALGRLRFNFRNRFSVYHHDTQDKSLFAQDVRAASHGCMRVQDPAKYAEVLLNIARPREHWTAARIKGLFGNAEQDIQLQPTPIWVHLTYQTAFADTAGKLQIRRDLYSLDSRTLAAIKRERGNLEPAPERKRDQEIAAGAGTTRSSARPARTATQSISYDTPGYARPLTVQPIYR